MRLSLKRNLTRASCQEKKFYICSTTPSTDELDNNCPLRFYPYKNHCLLPSPKTASYSDAKVNLSYKIYGLYFNISKAILYIVYLNQILIFV